jgi:LPS export ABC transporter permease LptG
MSKLFAPIRRLGSFLSPLFRWLRHGKGVTGLFFWVGLLDLILWTGYDIGGRWTEELMNHVTADLDDDGLANVGLSDAGYALYIRTLVRAGLCLAPAFFVWLLRRKADNPWPVLPTAVASAWLCLIAISNSLYHGLPAALQSDTGDQPYPIPFAIGIGLTILLFASLPACVLLYARGSVLDRYVTRAILTPFSICYGAFVSIWLISDLADNGPDFAAGNLNLGAIATLYAIQLPAVTVLVLPITLLLGLLYALGSMSRRNELVSMMIAGRSVVRILRPVFVIGIFATFVSLAFNYQWAPAAAGTAEAAVEAASKKKKSRHSAYDIAYINRAQNRIWFVGRYPQNYSRDNKLESVIVAQFQENGNLLKTIHADKVFWQRDVASWVFFNGQVTHFDEDGEPKAMLTFPAKYFEENWPETPWRIVSAGLKPEFLGLPQIQAYLDAYHDSPSHKLAPFLTHWHYRLALPFSCMVVVLFGAPLGIVYSRRGIVGSVTAAVVLFFASMFLGNLFVALGQSDRLPPLLAAWLPVFILTGVGVWLVRLRSHNREVPSLKRLLKPPRLRKA